MEIRNHALVKVNDDDIKDGIFIIPKNITSIRDHVFEYRVSLTSVQLPESIISIGKFAFAWRRSLAFIKYQGKKINTKCIDGNLMEILSIKTLDEYTIHKAKYFNEENIVWVAELNNILAHGNTLKEAIMDLKEKIFNTKTEEERIQEFLNHFSDHEKQYPNEDFFFYHHVLTLSCRQGRDKFAKDHNIDVEHGTMTVKEFLELTKNNHRSEVIQKVLQMVS